MSPAASSNWLKLQQKLKSTTAGGSSDKRKSSSGPDRKRRKLHHQRSETGSVQGSVREPSPAPSYSSHAAPEDSGVGGSHSAADNSVKALRKMVGGHVEFTEKQQLPGKYLSVDCEMVGVGLEGAESSLARVSIVNFYGAVILDEFVKQRERVVDYRTQWSGIRPSDMAHAKPFPEIQKEVAELLKDRVLIGHAVHNDLKALLLSHPYPLTRDTQVLAYKAKVTKSKRVALRNLVKEQLDVTIQSGEHSSVTDARATMAIYRLHKKKFDKLLGSIPKSLLSTDPSPSSSSATTTVTTTKTTIAKRKSSTTGEDEEDEDEGSIPNSPRASTSKPKNSKPSSMKGKLPGSEGRKGVSSGLSTVVVRNGVKTKHGTGGAGGGKPGKGGGSTGGGEKSEWWKQLPTTTTSAGMKKGSMRL